MQKDLADTLPFGTTAAAEAQSKYVPNPVKKTSSGVPLLSHISPQTTEYRLDVGWSQPLVGSSVPGFMPSARLGASLMPVVRVPQAGMPPLFPQSRIPGTRPASATAGPPIPGAMPAPSSGQLPIPGASAVAPPVGSSAIPEIPRTLHVSSIPRSYESIQKKVLVAEEEESLKKVISDLAQEVAEIATAEAAQFAALEFPQDYGKSPKLLAAKLIADSNDDGKYRIYKSICEYLFGRSGIIGAFESLNAKYCLTGSIFVDRYGDRTLTPTQITTDVPTKIRESGGCFLIITYDHMGSRYNDAIWFDKDEINRYTVNTEINHGVADWIVRNIQSRGTTYVSQQPTEEHISIKRVREQGRKHVESFGEIYPLLYVSRRIKKMSHSRAIMDLIAVGDGILDEIETLVVECAEFVRKTQPATFARRGGFVERKDAVGDAPRIRDNGRGVQDEEVHTPTRPAAQGFPAPPPLGFQPPPVRFPGVPVPGAPPMHRRGAPLPPPLPVPGPEAQGVARRLFADAPERSPGSPRDPRSPSPEHDE